MEHESKNYRRIKLERRAREAIIKFSRHDLTVLNDYQCEEQSEIMSWIHLAITECSKRFDRYKELNTK
jgi:hypothetical protein